MDEKFQEYVTSASFSLQLSRPQIEMLSQIDQEDGTWGTLGTAYALERKGFVTWEGMEDYGMTRKPSGIRLTEAGVAVIPLLKLSGLYVDYPRHEPVELDAPDVTIKVTRKGGMHEQQ